MCVAVKSHALPVYKKNRIASLLCIFETTVLFCQPRVEVTSCFVYKVMGLTFYDRINTQLIYRFELAQVVARRITKPQRKFLGSNLTGCSFFIQIIFTFIIFLGEGVLILLFSSCPFFSLFSFYYFFYFFIPLTCIRHIYKNICNNTNYCKLGGMRE